MLNLNVTKVNRIFADGAHNAFPNIAKFKGFVYICFRSATNHLAFDGRITVIRSSDNKHWETAAIIKTDNGEFRDPVIVNYKNKLWVYAGKRYENCETRDSVVFESLDGIEFKRNEISGGLESLFAWNCEVFNDTLYFTAYKNLKSEGRLAAYAFKSFDGIHFDQLFEYPIVAGEVAIDFDGDGVMYSLIRDDYNGSVPTLLKAEPPYAKFVRLKTLPMILQGPCLKRLADTCVIIGRNWDEPGRRNLRTDIHVLDDDGRLRFIRSLPSGGDNSYASWLDIEPGKAILVYYSAHEYRMDADVGEKLIEDPAAPEHNCGADIYLAEISYA